MGEITTRKAGGAPAIQTPELHRLTAVLRNKIEVDGTTSGGQDRCSISSLNAPTEAQRGLLMRRRNELADALTPRAGDHEALADAVLEMFYCWSDTRRMPADRLTATASKYVAVLADVPLWAVVKACEQVARQDLAWPPSPGEVRATALRLTQAPNDELADLKRVLGASVYQPSERGADAIERVREAADTFRKGTGKVVEPVRHEKLRHAYFENRDRQRAAAATNSTLSDEALATFGLRRPAPHQEAAE